MDGFTLVNINKPFNPDDDFWELNKHLLYVDFFKKLKKKYRGKKSSYYCWALWVYANPSSHNPFFNLPEKIKIETIQKFSTDFDLEEEDVQEELETFMDLNLTAAQRAFKEELEGLKFRASIINNAYRELKKIAKDNPLGLSEHDKTLKIVESMQKSTKTIYEQYEKVKEIFILEEGEIVIHGGGKESIIDKGGLVQVDRSKL